MGHSSSWHLDLVEEARKRAVLYSYEEIVFKYLLKYVSSYIFVRLKQHDETRNILYPKRS